MVWTFWDFMTSSIELFYIWNKHQNENISSVAIIITINVTMILHASATSCTLPPVMFSHNSRIITLLVYWTFWNFLTFILRMFCIYIKSQNADIFFLTIIITTNVTMILMRLRVPVKLPPLRVLHPSPPMLPALGF